MLLHTYWTDLLTVGLEDHHESAVHACDWCFFLREPMCSCCAATFRCTYTVHALNIHIFSDVHTQDQHKLCQHSSLSRHQITFCCAPTHLLVSTDQYQVRTTWRVDFCTENYAQQSATVMKQTGGTCNFIMLSSEAKSQRLGHTWALAL